MQGPAGLTLTALNTSILIILLTAIVLVVRRYFSGARRSPRHEYLLESPNEVAWVVLSEKTVVNHDTLILRFLLPARHMKLGIGIGQHIIV